MKKIFLVAVLFSATTFAFAQTKTTEAYDAVEASRTMSENLMLNEGQYVQIRALNNVKQERYRDIDALYANDPAMRQQKLDALNAEMDAEYEKVLKPNQYQSYLELEGRTSASNQGMTDDTMPQMDQMNMDQTDPATSAQTETKIKTGDTKMKSEPGKAKIETSDSEAKTKTSGSQTKSKMQRPDGTTVKEESDKNKYKHQDSRDNSKVKAKDDKLKMEDKNGKIKVEDDKVKIKSRD